MTTLISKSGLSTRARNVLIRRLRLETLEQVAAMTSEQLGETRDCGATTFNEIKEELAGHGLRFADDPLATPPMELAKNMTLRDYFAAAALTGILSASPAFTHDDDGDDDSLTNTPKIAHDLAAEEAYAYADCMLKERERHV